MSTAWLKIEHRTNVQATDRRVSIKGALGSMARHDLAERSTNAGRCFGATAAIFDERHGLAIAVVTTQAAAAAQPFGRPRRAHIALIDGRNMYSRPACPAVSRAPGLGLDFVCRIATELDQHHRLGIADDEIEIVAIFETPRPIAR